MWIARDSDGDLRIYEEKPYKLRDCWCAKWNTVGEYAEYSYWELPNHLFPDLTFDSEPIEVFIMTKEDKEKEFNKGVKFATDTTVALMKTGFV